MGQRHVCTFRHAQRAAYRTAISLTLFLCVSIPIRPTCPFECNIATIVCQITYHLVCWFSLPSAFCLIPCKSPSYLYRRILLFTGLWTASIIICHQLPETRLWSSSLAIGWPWSSTAHVWNLLRTEGIHLRTPALQTGTHFLLTLETIVFLFHLLGAISKPFSSLSTRLAHAARFGFFFLQNALHKFTVIMRPSSLGGAAYCVALCLSVCPSVPLLDEVFLFYTRTVLRAIIQNRKTSVFAYGQASRM